MIGRPDRLPVSSTWSLTPSALVTVELCIFASVLGCGGIIAQFNHNAKLFRSRRPLAEDCRLSRVFALLRTWDRSKIGSIITVRIYESANDAAKVRISDVSDNIFSRFTKRIGWIRNAGPNPTRAVLIVNGYIWITSSLATQHIVLAKMGLFTLNYIYR